MKWIFAVLLLNVSLAFAAEPKYEVDENHNPREEQQYNKEYDDEGADTQVKEVKKEQHKKTETKVNKEQETDDEMMGPSAD